EISGDKKLSDEMLEIVQKVNDYYSQKYEEDRVVHQLKEERYDLFVEGTSAGIWDWVDMEKNAQWWSPQYYKLLGFKPGEIESSYSSFLNTVHPDDLESLLRHLHVHFDSRTPISIELRIRTKGGSYKWFLANGQFSENKKGKYNRLVGSIIDINDHIIAEEKLQKSEERFRNLIESAKDIFFTADKGGNYTYVNEVAYEKLGFKPGELIGVNYLEIVHPEHRKTVQNFYFRQILNKNPHSYLEFPIVGKNGENLWVGQNAQLAYKNNEYAGVQAVVRDITNIKNAELALKTSEERFRKLVQYSTDVTTIIQPDGTFTYVSPSIMRLFGYTESLVGHNAFAFIHPDDLQRAQVELQRAIEKGGVSDPIELRFRTPAGDYKYIETIGNNLMDEPSIRGIVLNSREINERKKVEAALAETSGRLNAIIESTNNSIYAIDREYRYIALNDSHRKRIKQLYGVEIEQGQIALIELETMPLSDRNNIKLGFDKGLAGENYSFIHETMLDDRKMFFDISFHPIIDRVGYIIGVAVYAQDITGKKEAEIELLRAKNEAELATRAKSDFLSNMSHEIRTPMNAIVALTNLLMEKEFDAETNEYLKSIHYSADNLLVVINDILDFSKIESGKITFEKIDFNLRYRMEEVVNLMTYKVNEKNLHLSLNIDPAVPEIISGDPYRLHQILVNLVGNSVKFTHQGFVKILVCLAQKEEEFYRIRFTVSDSGIGIPEDKQQSIFESFTQAFTDTTRRYGGTGLGLAITKNLVQMMGGCISLKSTIGVGTEFQFELSFELGTHDEQLLNHKGILKDKDLRGKRILLVEDNQMNQYVAKQIMNKWNAIITVVASGEESINALSEKDFDVVLMDLQMPQMSGYDAVEFIRSKNTTVKSPSIPVIALTADAFAETKRKVFEVGMNDFITKPFNPEELFQKIKKHTEII
ncbi:MAG: PAS domain S-box protein, partial [Bacteroidia bacterium]